MEKNSWNANQYKTDGSFVSKMAMGVVELLDPQKDEKIFDVGCGEGELAIEIQKLGAQVFGIDMSEDMVQSAQEKGIDAKVEDILQIQYANEFDAVFSNAVLHWVSKPEIVAQNIHKSLKKDGRFVGEFGGFGNCATLIQAIEEVFKENPKYGEFNNPWYFPTKQEYKSLLEEEGFDVEYMELIPRVTPLKDIITWLELFANGIIKHLDKNEQKNCNQNVQEKVKTKLYDQEIGWFVDYVRLRFIATK